MADDIVKVVDAKGLQCPMPLLKAKQALNSVEVGSVIEVWATDAGSFKDFHAFAAATRHELLKAAESQGVFHYLIKKGPLLVRKL
jgi:tRNA 2-thiouridine synthesizing protein A